MAGIGFELRRIVDTRPGLVAKMRAYASAGLVSSGPWLATMLTLMIVSISARAALGEMESERFRSLVTYAFGLSLLTVGTVQMVYTRHVSDLLFREEYSEVLTAFTAGMRSTCLVQTVVGLGVGMWMGLEPSMVWLFTALYVVVSAIWLAVSWLTIVRCYDEILVAYLIGMAISVSAMQFPNLGIESAFGAYTLGQALTLALLVRLILRGTEAGAPFHYGVVRSLARYPGLIGVGLFYSAAIWVDKVIFWYRDGISAGGLVFYHPLYDTACYLAYLTVVPAMAVNLIHVETSFYELHRSYYQAVLQGMNLREIEWRRAQMMVSLREGTDKLLRMQGWITAAVILFAEPLLDGLGMPVGAVRVFRITALGAFFHILFMIAVLVQLYFDLRREVLRCSLLFFVSNAALTWVSMDLGPMFYGTGYTISALLSLVVAYHLLQTALESLEYLTFARLTVAQASKAPRKKRRVAPRP